MYSLRKLPEYFAYWVFYCYVAGDLNIKPLTITFSRPDEITYLLFLLLFAYTFICIVFMLLLQNLRQLTIFLSHSLFLMANHGHVHCTWRIVQYTDCTFIYKIYNLSNFCRTCLQKWFCDIIKRDSGRNTGDVLFWSL